MSVTIIIFAVVWVVLGFIAQAMFRAAVYAQSYHDEKSANHYWRMALLPNFLVPPAGILATLQTWGWCGVNWFGTYERK